MAMRYGYFDSEITGVDENGMPIFDRAETSDLFRMLFANLVSSGVLASPGDCFQVVAGTGMTVKIRPGFAMIKGAFAYDADETTVALAVANATLPRLDRVVLRCNYHDRCCEIIVKTGTPATIPTAPELLRPENGDYYELGLALIVVAANQTAITQSSISDTRADSNVCGFITQLIDHIDTSVFMQQLTTWMNEYEAQCQNSFGEWFDEIKGQLSEDAAGNLQLQIDDLAQSAETNSENIGQLTEDLDDLKTNTIGSTAMGTTATTIKGAIRELKDKLGSVAMGTAATTVTGAIKELLTKINTLSSTLTTVSNRVGTANLNTSAKNALAAINELLTKINTANSNITAANNRINTTNSNLSTTNSNVTAVANRATNLETKTAGIVKSISYDVAANSNNYKQLNASSMYLLILNGGTTSNTVRGIYQIGVTGGKALGIKAISAASIAEVTDGGSGLLKVHNTGSVVLRATLITTYGS